MGKIFNHTAHKALWNWLAGLDKEPDNLKEFLYDENKDEISIGSALRRYWFAKNNYISKNNCFACDYDSFFDEIGCKNCPLIWPENKTCGIAESLFAKHLLLKIFSKERKEFSLQIANLPVKEGVKCI